MSRKSIETPKDAAMEARRTLRYDSRNCVYTSTRSSRTSRRRCGDVYLHQEDTADRIRSVDICSGWGQKARWGVSGGKTQARGEGNQGRSQSQIAGRNKA